MSISDEEMLSYVVERDIDLVFVQLIETAPEFRSWFLDQLDENIEVEEYLGIRHSMERDTGESDIEIKVQTTSHESHIVLVENKIDASLQDRQAERYFERGENYVENEGWDEYSVALIAPANYVGRGERVKFGNVVEYEDLVNQIEVIEHDGSAFFQRMFHEATSKRASRIDSYWTDEVERRLKSKLDDLPPIDIYQKSNKHLRVESVQPEHPYHVLYNVFFPSDFDGEKAVIRLNLTGRKSGSVSDEEFDSLHPILLSQLAILDQFEARDRPMDPIKTVVWRHDFTTDDAYISKILDRLSELIEVYHPALVKQRTTGTIEHEDGQTEDFEVYRVEEPIDRYPDDEQDRLGSDYWIMYGLDPSETDLIPENSISLSVPDLFTVQGMDDLQIVLIPKESEIRIIYD